MSIDRAIIRILQKNPTSLADLQAETQVSLPTIRRAVQELTDAQWICIVGQAEANGGRPAMLYGMDDRLYVTVGLHLELPGVRLIISDLRGNILDEIEMFNGIVPTLSVTITSVVDYITNFQHRFPERRILGIGIAAPGFIDPNTGDIITIGRVPTWANFPFCRRLQAAVGLPVEIANDVDCMAFAEFEHTREPLQKNLAYVGFDEGVKVSLFLKGEVYKGSLGNAGLISRHLLNVGDEPNLKELTSLLSFIGVNQAFEKKLMMLESAERELYAIILSEANPRARFNLIVNNAYGEMPLCHETVLDLIKVLSAAIANMIYIVQPNVIVVGGLLTLLPKGIYMALEQGIREHLPTLINNNSIIYQGSLMSQNSAAIGAIHHLMQEYINNPATDIIPGS